MRGVPLTTPFVHLCRTRPMQVAIGLYAAITFAYAAYGDDMPVGAGLIVAFLGLGLVTTASRTVAFGLLVALTAVIGFVVAVNFYTIANHGFMLVWTGLALAIARACDPPQDEVMLRRMATMLLAILMAFALIQKLREPYYMSGDLLGGLLIQGEIYRNLISLVLPEWPDLVQDYELAFQGLLAEPAAASAAIAVPPAIAALAWRMTLGSLIAQGVLELLILFRARVGMLLHVGILGFVAVVYSTRDENVFLSLNCLLGYAMTDERTAAARPWYVLAAVYLLVASIIGLRPWILS